MHDLLLSMSLQCPNVTLTVVFSTLNGLLKESSVPPNTFASDRLVLPRLEILLRYKRVSRVKPAEGTDIPFKGSISSKEEESGGNISFGTYYELNGKIPKTLNATFAKREELVDNYIGNVQ